MVDAHFWRKDNSGDLHSSRLVQCKQWILVQNTFRNNTVYSCSTDLKHTTLNKFIFQADERFDVKQMKFLRSRPCQWYGVEYPWNKGRYFTIRTWAERLRGALYITTYLIKRKLINWRINDSCLERRHVPRSNCQLDRPASLSGPSPPPWSSIRRGPPAGRRRSLGRARDQQSTASTL
jgi:hypothetical protein